MVLILVGGSGASALAFYTVRGEAAQLQAKLTLHLQAGQSELELAKASLKAANSSHDQGLIAQTTVHFTTAKVQFMLARQIADSSGVVRQLEAVPTVGELARSRMVAVDGIADMGVAISDAGQELTDLAGQLIKPATTGGEQALTLLTLLNKTSSSLDKVRADLIRAQQAATQVDLRVLPAGQQATLAKARDTITTALTSLDEFQRLAPVLTEILGGNGARTLLIEQTNPAELRAGGGFIGTFSVLRADHGTLRTVRNGTAYLLADPRPSAGQAGYVAPPGPLRETLLANTSWSFVDSNFFPDFPSNAKAAIMFAQPRLGVKIDAVISIDYYAVAKMLELTGPMVVPGYKLTFDSTNFISQLIQDDLVGGPNHKAILAAIAGPLMDRVATMSPDRWPTLISAFNGLATGRHLQAYFTNDLVEKEIERIGWSGELNPTAARDYMMEVESNLGATKANYFVTRTFTVELTLSGAVLHHKVTIDIRDDMPYIYRPVEYYSAYIRLYLADTASPSSNNLRAVKYPNPAPPPGTRMMDGWVPTFHGYGHSAQAVFSFDTPWQANAKGEDQIYWQKQPGTSNDKVVVTWNDGIGHSYTASGDLGQDRVITLAPGGITVTPGQAAQAELPSLSLG